MSSIHTQVPSKRTRLHAMLALALAMAGASASAQDAATARVSAADAVHGKNSINVPCCQCADGKSKTIDISTGVAPWSSPSGALSPVGVSPGWKTPVAPAKWVYTGSSNPGEYTYNLAINVPKNCLLTPKVRFEGEAFGDNNITVRFDKEALGTTAVSSGGQANYGFRDPYGVKFTGQAGPGTHVLSVTVKNEGGPTGFLMMGKLHIECPKSPFTEGQAPLY
jgi:hypothetical protein